MKFINHISFGLHTCRTGTPVPKNFTMDGERKGYFVQFLLSVLLLPLYVCITRLRVEYRPVMRERDETRKKSDKDALKQAHSNNAQQSSRFSLFQDVLAMMKRIKDLEGWSGLWSGILPKAALFVLSHGLTSYLNQRASQIQKPVLQNPENPLIFQYAIGVLKTRLLQLSYYGFSIVVLPLLLLPLEVIAVRYVRGHRRH